jgi:quercetin dioxygenase-like cupin family protein
VQPQFPLAAPPSRLEGASGRRPGDLVATEVVQLPLYARGNEIKNDIVTTQHTRMSTKMVRGNESTLMLATRPGGYHSRPHKHDTEQMNYVLDGEIWVFVEDQFFLVKAGDFYRVPRNAVHWGWITSDQPCTILEVFAPAYVASGHQNVAPLFADGEAPAPLTGIKTEYVSDEYRKIEAQLPIQRR